MAGRSGETRAGGRHAWGSPAAGVPSAKLRPPLPLGLARDRLTRPLLEDHPRLWIVHGFAGCGKTTVLAHAAEGWPGRTAWVTVDGTDRTGDRFVRALASAAGMPALARDHPDPADAVFAVLEALEATAQPTLLVVDDAHELVGAPAADALDLLCRYRPAGVTVVLGARHVRGLDHWRWRTGGDVGEVDSDGLRFRLWEVDTLFRRHYGTPLTSHELHTVSRITDGWAVALHLFHVATRTIPAAEWHRLTSGPRLTIRSIRDYLAGQVLATVADEDRSLLRRVAVLDRIRPDRCEGLLGSSGAAPRLQWLAQVGLLLPDPDGVTYRMHELLRAHLLGELDDELGSAGVAGLHRLAADLLEAEGDLTEAVRASGRGGDWDGVRRLLSQGDGGVVLSSTWAEGLPRDLRDTDPWLLRALGRRQLGEGDLLGARATLAASLERFQEHGGDRQARRQLHLLDGWLDPDPGQQRTWTECLRAALAGETVAVWPDEPAGWLAEGLACLAVGRVARSADVLRPAADTLADELGTLADLGLCLAVALGDHDPRPATERAFARARSCDAAALTAVAESLAAFVAGEPVAPDLQVAAAQERSDDLGAALLCLIGGLTLLRGGSGDTPTPTIAPAPGGGGAGGRALPAVETAGLGRVGPLAVAVERFGRAGLPVLAALARAAALVAEARAGTIAEGALPAEVVMARAVGPLPHALALVAQWTLTGDTASEQQARALAGQHGFGGFVSDLLSRAGGTGGAGTDAAVIVVAAEPAPADPSPSSPSLEVRCLGELRIVVDGIERDVEQLRPRHQELLGVLAVHANAWLHRERLYGWLWPEATVDRATRNLQVAVSAVRRVVEPDAVPGQPTVLVRSGERYRLVVEPGRSDVGRLEEGLRAARTAARSGADNGDGDPEAAARQLEAALDEWVGEPAAWSGPTDWAVEAGRRLAHAVGTVAVAVIEALCQAGAYERASGLAVRAVDIDPLDPQLWRLAVHTADEVGAAVLASDLERRYRQLTSSPAPTT